MARNYHSFLVHRRLQHPDFAFICPSFDSTNSLKVVGLCLEWVGKNEAKTLVMLGSIVDASQVFSISVCLSFQEVEAVLRNKKALEEPLSVNTDANGNWSEEFVFWPGRAVFVERRFSPEEYWLLLC